MVFIRVPGTDICSIVTLHAACNTAHLLSSFALQEPLLEAMELLQHSDVVIGMHGAGWTNGMFVKHGAVAMQMFPYGWRLPDNSTIRGWVGWLARWLDWMNLLGGWVAGHDWLGVVPDSTGRCAVLLCTLPDLHASLPFFPPLSTAGTTIGRLCWPLSAATLSGLTSAGTTPSSAASTSTDASSE